MNTMQDMEVMRILSTDPQDPFGAFIPAADDDKRFSTYEHPDYPDLLFHTMDSSGLDQETADRMFSEYWKKHNLDNWRVVLWGKGRNLDVGVPKRPPPSSVLQPMS